eukprot:3240862-Pyramimonas_sp.AAC.1
MSMPQWRSMSLLCLRHVCAMSLRVACPCPSDGVDVECYVCACHALNRSPPTYLPQDCRTHPQGFSSTLHARTCPKQPLQPHGVSTTPQHSQEAPRLPNRFKPAPI